MAVELNPATTALNRSILETSSLLLENDPDYFDNVTLPGHFPWTFTGKRSGSLVETTDPNQPWVFDGTNAWMTLPVDPQKFAADKELLEQIGMAALSANTLSEFGTNALASFTGRLKEIWPPMHRALLYNSGTQATDAAMKWAGAIVMRQKGFEPKDMKFMACENAFHGRCGGGIEATRESPKTSDYQTGSVLRVPDPVVVYDEIGDIDQHETRLNLERSLSVLEEGLQKQNTAALIIEYPMIAEGGAKVIHPQFLGEARNVCDENGKFLIVDAVQMFGKVGSWLPADVALYADAACIGKYSRVCTAMLRDTKERGFEDYAGIPGKFGATWQGSEAGILSTLAIMKVVEDGNMFENGVLKAQSFYTRMRELAIEGKGIVRPRRVGSYIGFDVHKSGTEPGEDRNKLLGELEKNGVLILGAGESSVRFAPRLDTEDWEIEFLCESVEKALEKV